MMTFAQRVSLAARCLYLRHFPVNNGKWRLVPNALKDCEQVFRESDMRIVRTKYGFKIAIDRTDWLGRHVYVTGDYEPDTSRLIWNSLSPGDTFVDVGANIGFFSLLAAKRVGSKGRVISCEPVTYVRDRLQDNFRLNGFRNCNVYSEAASNISGECDFFQGPPEHVGISSLGQIDKAAGVFRVATRRLDDLLEVEGISLVKIDVEGAECHVLEGLQSALEKYKPALIIEITPRYLKRLGRSVRDIETLLSGFGYESYVIGNGDIKKVRVLPAEEDSQFNAFFTIPRSCA